MGHKAVLLDRDGTINRDFNYVNSPGQLELLPNVGAAISLLNRRRFKVVVVSNQSGVARGYLDLKTLGAIHRRLRHLLKKEGAKLDAIYYCPFHPDDDPPCRKPKTGMAERASRELGIDLGRSYMVGDSRADIEFGNNIGARTVLVLTGKSNGTEPWMKKCRVDCIAHDLLGAALWIIQDSRGK
jgi:histidinol-phosphate phosphatase family protein